MLSAPSAHAIGARHPTVQQNAALTADYDEATPPARAVDAHRALQQKASRTNGEAPTPAPFSPASKTELEGAIQAYNPSDATSNYGGEGLISTWDTSRVNDMSYLFYYDPNFNEDISSWDTSAVTDMSAMFLW